MKKCFIVFLFLLGMTMLPVEHTFADNFSISIPVNNSKSQDSYPNNKPEKTLHISKKKNYDKAIGENKIIRTLDGQGLKYGFKKLLNPDSAIIEIANYIFAAIALIWLSIVGGKFVLSGGEEEKQAKYKTQFGWIILGLLVLSSAEFIAFSIFDPTTTGGLTNDTGINGFLEIVRKVTVFLKYLVGAVALLAGVRSGMALIIGGEEDEVIQKEKEFVKIFLFAIALILLAESIERWIDLSLGGFGIQADRIVVEIVGIINFILTFIAGAALFMVVLSSLYYVISMGDEETTGRAKKMIISSIIGLVIAYSAFTIVSFLT